MKRKTSQRESTVEFVTGSAGISHAYPVAGRTHRFWAIATFLVLILMANTARAEPDKHIISFDIPRQRADVALTSFAKQADRTLMFSFDVTQKFTANHLYGEFDIKTGLENLLSGTGLAITLAANGQFSIIDTSKRDIAAVSDDPQKSFFERLKTAFTGGGSNSTDSEAEALTLDSKPYLEEIVVTSRKREERLQDIPTSASALSRLFLHNMNSLNDLRSLTDLVIGVTINDTNLHFVSEPSIRGGGAGRNRMSASATGLYRNGAYIASAGPGGKNFSRMDYYDLERAEILRGPQGALHGRNALGGAINLISRKPEDTFGIDLTLRTGELDLRAGEIILNMPLNDQFALRLGRVEEDRSKGFFKNLDGDYVDKVDHEHTRLSLRYQPSEAVEINYVYDTQDTIFTPTIRLTPQAAAFTGSQWDTMINDPHFDTWDIENHNLNIGWDLGTGTMTFVANYRDKFVEAVQDADYYTAATGYVNYQNRRKFSQVSDATNSFEELRYVSDGTNNVMWLFGADHFEYDNHDVTDLTRGCPSPAVPDLVSEDFFCASALWIRKNNFGMNNWAVFGSVEVAFDAVPITLTAEARYAVDKFRGHLRQFRPNMAPFPQIMRDFVVNDDWQNVPWGLTASYRFENLDAIGYFKVASSYRHGGMNDGPGNKFAKFQTKLSYDEETNITYELGWKQTLFDGAMTFNFASYYGHYDEFIAGTVDGCPDECTLLDTNGEALGFNPDGSRIGEDENGDPVSPNTALPETAFMDNVGKASLWGFEAEFSYRKVFTSTGGSMTFNLGYAKQNGEVTDVGSDVAEALSRRALDAPLIYTVPNQIKSQLVFQQPLSGLAGIPGFSGATFVGSANYVYEEGGFWGLGDVPDTVDDESNPMDTVKRLNTRLGLETDQWSLMISGTNITNEDYHLWNNDPQPATQWRSVNPRYWSMEFKYQLR